MADGIRNRITQFVEEVLRTAPRPLNETVIDDVFQALEASPQWLLRYEAFASESIATNAEIGRAVRIILGAGLIYTPTRRDAAKVDARSRLVGRVTRLNV